MFQRQLELEEKYSKHQQYPLLMKLFQEAEIVTGDNSELVLKLLVHVAIQKRMPIAAAIGILSQDVSLEIAACVVEFCVLHNLVGLSKDTLIVHYEPSLEMQNQIAMYMFLPPMVVEPLRVTSNRHSGYLTVDTSTMTKGSHTGDDICLDVINILNSFEFSLDLDVLEHSNMFESLKAYKQGETPEEYRKRIKQWKRFDTTTRELIAEHYADVSSIWFTHKYDKRGRMYCQGYNISYQGSEWNKAMVQVQPEMLND